MKETIIAAIKAKYPAINLSKARLNAIAAKIEAEVIDDETKIDAALDAFNKYNPIAEIAKQDDLIRNLQAKAKDPGQQNPPKDKDPIESPKDDDTPAWAKSLIESNKSLTEKLAKIEGKEAQTTMQKTLSGKLKDVPSGFWNKRALPEKEEDVDAFIEEVNTDYSAFTKDMTDKGISLIPTPGGGGKAGDAKPVSTEIRQFVQKNTPAAQQK